VHFFRATLGSRLFLAKAHSLHLCIRHPQQCQGATNGFSALLAQSQVVFAATALVCVALMRAVWLLFAWSTLVECASRRRDQLFERIEPWLHWSRAVPVLVAFVGIALAAGAVGYFKTIAAASLAASAAFGFRAVFGATAFAAFGLLSLQAVLTTPNALVLSAVLAAPLCITWLADRLSVFVLSRKNSRIDVALAPQRRREWTGIIACASGLALFIAVLVSHF